MNNRYRFVQDNDYHWYAIPAEKRDAFENWIEAISDDLDYVGEGFDRYRLNMHPSNYTFLDIQEAE